MKALRKWRAIAVMVIKKGCEKEVNPGSDHRLKLRSVVWAVLNLSTKPYSLHLAVPDNRLQVLPPGLSGIIWSFLFEKQRQRFLESYQKTKVPSGKSVISENVL